MNASLQLIIKLVADLTHLAAADIVSDRRQSDLVRARFIIIGLARTYTHYSLPRIGAALGNRDHATIMNAVERCNALIISDADFASLYHRAEAAIYKLTDHEDPSIGEIVFTDHVAAMLAELDTLVAATNHAIGQLRSRHAALAYARQNLESLKEAS
jgi:hypothetical protein